MSARLTVASGIVGYWAKAALVSLTRNLAAEQVIRRARQLSCGRAARAHRRIFVSVREQDTHYRQRFRGRVRLLRGDPTRSGQSMSVDGGLTMP